jgi:hypothetical protein
MLTLEMNMTDPAIVAMEEAGDKYRASLAAFRIRQRKENAMNWITNPMPLLRLTYQPVEIPRAAISNKVLTKAAQVREKIADAKKKHQSHNTVVEWAVQTLQMSKGQAARYVTENWKRA